MFESTLVLIKPDGLQKSLTGNILTRLSETQLEIVAVKIVRVSRALAEEHYRDLREQPFFDEIVAYLQGAQHACKRVMALIYVGDGAIAKVRALAGATNPEAAKPTTIRGSYGRITTAGLFENVIHASSSATDAEREIKLWFGPDDVLLDIYPSRMITATREQRTWA